MTFRTQQSISGFIASDPQLTQTDRGDARFYARFGQENFRREDDGTFTKLETTFHNLVMYRATAERAYERFTKGEESDRTLEIRAHLNSDGSPTQAVAADYRWRPGTEQSRLAA